MLFRSRVLGLLYYINRISEPTIIDRCRKRLWLEAIVFVVLFLGFVAYLFLKEGYAIMPITNIIYIEPYKYFLNFVQQPILLIILIVGVFLVLFGILRTLLSATSYKGIWFAGLGTTLTVLSVLLVAGYNNTAYFPSTVDMQYSLTLANSCSSEFTLRTMAYVSIFIPIVLIYIFYAWRSIDNKKINIEKIEKEENSY